MNKDKVFSCSALNGGSTRGWFSVVMVNNTGTLDDTAGAAFVCGFSTFDMALRAGYSKAAANAKGPIKALTFRVGVASPPDVASVKNRSGEAYSFAWYCHLGEYLRRDEQRKDWTMEPIIPLPSNLASTTELRIGDITGKCGTKFSNVPAGYTENGPPPKF